MPVNVVSVQDFKSQREQEITLELYREHIRTLEAEIMALECKLERLNNSIRQADNYLFDDGILMDSNFPISDFWN